MPVVSSFVSVSLIWLWLYEPQFGLLNDIFEFIGIPRIKWLRSPDTSMLFIIIMSVWKNMGLNMVIYLAGLQGIPPHRYEAADIDGASGASKFFRITLPLLAPTTFFAVIMFFVHALQIFVQVFIMTSQSGCNSGVTGGPIDSTITVVLLIYDNAFQYLKLGYAAAMSFVLFLIIALITIVNARLLRYDIGYQAPRLSRSPAGAVTDGLLSVARDATRPRARLSTKVPKGPSPTALSVARDATRPRARLSRKVPKGPSPTALSVATLNLPKRQPHKVPQGPSPKALSVATLNLARRQPHTVPKGLQLRFPSTAVYTDRP